MRFLLSLVFLMMASQAQAQAQPPTALESASAICIGPGIEIADPFEFLRGLPQKFCVKGCKEALKGCVKVVEAIDKCGVVFLKAVGKTAKPICQGSGGTKAECKTIKPIIKSDIDEWLNSNGFLILECVVDGIECFDVCR